MFSSRACPLADLEPPSASVDLAARQCGRHSRRARLAHKQGFAIGAAVGRVRRGAAPNQTRRRLIKAAGRAFQLDRAAATIDLFRTTAFIKRP